MINLREIYGDEFFDKTTNYNPVKYIPFIAGLLIDLAIAKGIILVFNVQWEFALLKIFLLMELFGLVKQFLLLFARELNYRVFVKKAITREVTHYINVYEDSIDWGNTATFDDLLLESAFNTDLSIEHRILAAMQYGSLAMLFSTFSWFDDKFYDVYSPIAIQHYDKAENIR